jgi:hypothetical protein
MVRNNEEKRNDCTRLDGHDMNLEIKLLRWPETGNYVLAFCRGSLEREGFKEIFRKVDQFTHRLSDCRIVIDMRDSNYILESTDIRLSSSISSKTFHRAIAVWHWSPRQELNIFVNWLC